MEEYYPNYDDINFDKILDKYEFKEKEKHKNNYDNEDIIPIYQEPRQLLIRNLISKNTVYDNILLYWNVGTGKTCASITIAEGFKEYVLNMRKKILVLVKNANIEKNFKNELLSECSRYAYVNKNQSNFLSKPAVTQMDILNKAEAMNRVTRKINKVYNFMTYGTFVNQVLGMKEFEKDNLGRNTTRQKRNPDGSLARKRPTNPIEDLNNTVIIIDEAHNVTNNDVYIALKKVLQRSYNYRLVLLTATPMYDNPKEIVEIANLLNMNNPDKILPIRNELFRPYNQNQSSLMLKGESDYLKSGVLKSGLTVVSELGKEMLMKSLKGKVSYLQANTTDFPEKIDMGEPILNDKRNKVGSVKVVYCNMSEYQNKVYKQALALDLNQPPSQESAELLDAEDNIAEDVVEVQQSSSLYKNSSDAATMSYPNNLFGKDGFEKFLSSEESKNILNYDGDLRKYSEKLYQLLRNIKNSPGNAFIYSNYVNYGGTALIKKLLLANGYKQYSGRLQNKSNEYNSFIVYDDSTSAEVREAQRKVFNSPDNKDGKYIKIIIGSPVISEGITLKNVRQVHILEPTWNMSRINQIIGRAVRNKSHESLPLNERNVEIYKYCSVHKNTNTYYIDKEKYILAEEKDRSNKVVERLLKQVAFDCHINPKNGTPYTADCDYMEDCNYKCMINPSSKRFDKFTYKLYIDFFEEFDIEITTSLIKDMFKKYFIYSITDIVNKLKEQEPIIENETIYNSLKQLINNKVILLDQYDREGFLIEKGDYIIFNPLDVDINTSLYSKMLDFSVDSNEYTLNDYVKSKLEQNLEVEEEVDQKVKGKKKPDVVHLSSEDLAYNKKIIKNHSVYGSYRERATKESGGLFGPIDGKFRIIDLRNVDLDEDDKRKNISGMAATSYNKKQLIDIVEYLEINNKEMQKYLGYPSDSINLKKLDIKQLVDILKKHMDKKKLVLK
jgi:superfamily II DNA or RNA helicase